MNPGQSYRTLGSLEKDSPPHPSTFCPGLLPLTAFVGCCLPGRVPHAHSQAASACCPPLRLSLQSPVAVPGRGRQTLVFIYLDISVARVPADDILLGCHDSILRGVFLLPLPRLLTFLHRFLFWSAQVSILLGLYL